MITEGFRGPGTGSPPWSWSGSILGVAGRLGAGAPGGTGLAGPAAAPGTPCRDWCRGAGARPATMR